jgi:hypothetical protein
MMFWELDRSAEGLRAARDVVDGLSRDAGAMIVAMNAPPAPFVPPQHHFAPGVALMVLGLASAQQHTAQLARARGALQPLFEFGTDLPYTAVQQMLDESAPYGVLHAYNKSIYLDDLCDDAIDVIASRLPAKTSPMSLLPIFPLGGAFSDVGDDDTAFGGRRTARYAVNMDAIAPDSAGLAADRAWVRSLWDALRPFASSSGSYVNFMTDYEEDRVRAAYGPAKYARLARIKAEYDPGNVFHRNANIKPA